MALTPNTFNPGARTTAGKQYALYLDLKDGKGFRFLCNTELNEQLNTTNETINTLCSEGNAEHELTNIDYVIPINAVLRKSDLTDDLYHIAEDINSLSNVTARLDNTLMDVRKEWDAVLEITNIGAAAEALVYIQGNIYRKYGTATITDGIPLEPTATISTGVITDTSAEINYTFSVNDGDTALSSIDLFEASNMSTPIQTESPLTDGAGTFAATGLTASTAYVAVLSYDGVELASELVTTLPTV